VPQCFFTNNYFLPRYHAHVEYSGDPARFRREQADGLLQGLDASEAGELLAELERERRRRLGEKEASLQRAQRFALEYRRLHPDIFTLRESFLTPEFRALAAAAKEACERGGSSRGDYAARDKGRLFDMRVIRRYPQQIYSFRMFEDEFCRKMVDEVRSLQASPLPKGRPNSMNNYGVLLREVGFYRNFLNPLLQHYLQPLCAVLFPVSSLPNYRHLPRSGPDEELLRLDHHRSFVVSYQDGADVDLAYHYDDSEVTLNLSLGTEFEDGGELLFGGLAENFAGDAAANSAHLSRRAVVHQRGVAVLHRGRHMHEAAPIEGGERHNLIMWMRSSELRTRQCPMCSRSTCSLIPM